MAPRVFVMVTWIQGTALLGGPVPHCGKESVGCVHALGLSPIDLSRKCSILQAQLLSNRPRSQQLQYLPEHGVHHIQVPGHSGGRLWSAEATGPQNLLVNSLRGRKSRERQRREAFQYPRLKYQGV